MQESKGSEQQRTNAKEEDGKKKSVLLFKKKKLERNIKQTDSIVEKKEISTFIFWFCSILLHFPGRKISKFWGKRWYGYFEHSCCCLSSLATMVECGFLGYVYTTF